MNGPAFRRAVADAAADALADFASDRLLPALAGDEVTRERLLRAMADSEHAAHGTFRRWADDEPDPDARATFEAVARQEADHRDRVLAVLDEPYEPADGGPLHTYLRSRSDTVQRLAAGLVARPLVSVASYGRLIEHFESEGDADAVTLARDLRAETDEIVEDGLAHLEERCDDEADWERGRLAAEYAVRVAHDDFEDGLRSAGVESEGTG
ncbi:MAG: rubrerythrin family protein [Haloferacaceae archaeon]